MNADFDYNGKFAHKRQKLYKKFGGITMSNCKIENHLLDESKIMSIIGLIKERELEYNSETVYILPEYYTDENDVLNGLAPNINKIFLQSNINCKLVYHKDRYTYLTLNDADIIFPLLFDISIGLVANVIGYYIDKFIKAKKSNPNIKVKFISKETKKEVYRQYEVEGDAESVINALKVLKQGEG